MRKYIQVLSLIFFNIPIQLFKYIPAPVLNCYSCPLSSFACPIGIIQHFSIIKTIPFFTIGIIIISGIMLARGFCSFLCPFGFLQDLIAKITRKKIKIEVNYKIQYLILILLVLLLPFLTKEPIFCYICPAGTLEAAIPTVLIEKYMSNDIFYSPILDAIGWIFYTKLLILFFTVTSSIYITRPFCKICPLGLILSWFNKVSLLRIPKIKSKLVCKKCNNCIDKCALKL